MIDPHLLADIRQAEGCKLIAYRDTLGKWTIGVGHLLDPAIDWEGHEITQDTADSLLGGDIAERTGQAHALVEWPALDTQCRQNAIIECVYNLGIEHWTAEFPKTRASIRAQSWTVAALNLMASPKWVAQVGRSRVVRLAGYLQRGSYSPSPV